MIPAALAWLGPLASVFYSCSADARPDAERPNHYVGAGVPMLLFEVALALWLIVKGVAGDVLPDRLHG